VSTGEFRSHGHDDEQFLGEGERERKALIRPFAKSTINHRQDEGCRACRLASELVERSLSMTDQTALDILKNSILLELRGRAFYSKMADQASSSAVREFFGMMAEEEEKHVKVLSEQYRTFQRVGSFVVGEEDDKGSASFASTVFSDQLKREISAASFEAAAIAAALSLERNAVRLYSERSQSAGDPGERALYQWLADWETEHLDFLSRIDREVTEAIWNDNHFWPS
jgi:rubrerythrin